ncbi:DUF7344 domain-containing protein [Natronobiforma cellulositropha]|uniref:DUF7344 domain-containing protein n=1 Tax=Natronobiforma cellulositropha TaxID=1679076 RepID=UPI0021D5996A|nr:hypothetical protein [Natronobiforma cellulositropha]
MTAELEGERPPGGGPGGDSRPERGEIFDLLSNHRRRYTIHYCKREGDPVALGDLAEHVAAWELEKEVSELTSAERKRVYTALQQTHLPTLERANMVVFDDRTVALTDRAAELEVYLDIVPGDSIPWGLYYLGLSALGLLALGGVASGVIPTDPVPALAWAAGVLGVVFVSALVHAVEGRRNRLGTADRPH